MQLQQSKVTYDIGQLKPVITEQSFNVHYNKIYKGYVDDFNEGRGDIPFNKAGAHLHGLYFENLAEYKRQGLYGPAAELIELRYGTAKNFVQTYMDTVNKLQGSGWVFMNTAGYWNIIPNNRIVDNIALVIDFWEHSYYPNFGNDREAYARMSLDCINWEVVNKRIIAFKEKKKERVAA